MNPGEAIDGHPVNRGIGWPLARIRRVAGPAAKIDPSALPVAPTDRAWHCDARIGIIFNRSAHRNLQQAGALPAVSPNLDWATPQTEGELTVALARFAETKVDVIVIDGGDGTVRDVLTAARPLFPGGMPKLAIVPSGKTNALALDLGIPLRWSLDDALATIPLGRTVQRSPIEIARVDQAGPVLCGFLFGAGGFVKATALAQGVHRLGAFRGVAVGMSIAGAVVQTIVGGAQNHWRQGERMQVALSDGRRLDQHLYLLLGTTLERIPLDIKPFGRVRRGLKLLAIDAPPRRVLLSLPALLTGSEAPWLARAGYHRYDTDRLALTLDGGFILDGEAFAGGSLTIDTAPPLDFVVA